MCCSICATQNFNSRKNVLSSITLELQRGQVQRGAELFFPICIREIQKISFITFAFSPSSHLWRKHLADLLLKYQSVCRCFTPFQLRCHWAIFHPEHVNTETQFSGIYWHKRQKWPTSSKKLHGLILWVCHMPEVLRLYSNGYHRNRIDIHYHFPRECFGLSKLKIPTRQKVFVKCALFFADELITV